MPSRPGDGGYSADPRPLWTGIVLCITPVRPPLRLQSTKHHRSRPDRLDDAPKEVVKTLLGPQLQMNRSWATRSGLVAPPGRLQPDGEDTPDLCCFSTTCGQC